MHYQLEEKIQQLAAKCRRSNLIDPRLTRSQRLQPVTGTIGWGILFAEGVEDTVPSQNELAFFDYSLFVSQTEVLDVHSIGNFELGTGEPVDALYN